MICDALTLDATSDTYFNPTKILMITAENYIPRIALFLSNQNLLEKTERILRERYSSLLIISDKNKLQEFPMSLLILVDTVKDVFDIRTRHPVEGTLILLVLEEEDSEVMSAAIEAGADDFIHDSMSGGDLIEKIEKYLEAVGSAT